MKTNLALVVSSFALVSVAYAQGTTFKDWVGRIVDTFFDPIIGILFALAILLFFWGLIKFILNVDDSADHSNGIQLMLWGGIGLFVLVSVFGIMNFAETVFF